MRVLVSGPFKLYYSKKLSANGEFYVHKPGEQVLQLLRKSYVGVMEYLLAGCAAPAPGKPRRYRYTTSHLAAVVHAYNSCRYPGQPSVIMLKRMRFRATVGVRTGIQTGSVRPDGRFFGEPVPVNTMSQAPAVTGALSLQITEASVRFALQPELVYKQGVQLLRYTYLQPGA